MSGCGHVTLRIKIITILVNVCKIEKDYRDRVLSIFILGSVKFQIRARARGYTRAYTRAIPRPAALTCCAHAVAHRARLLSPTCHIVLYYYPKILIDFKIS